MDPEDYDISRFYDSAYYSDYYADALKGAKVTVHSASFPDAGGAARVRYASPTITSYPVSHGDALLDGERSATPIDMSQLIDLVCPVCEAPIEAAKSYRNDFEYVFKIISKSCDCPVVSFIE